MSDIWIRPATAAAKVAQAFNIGLDEAKLAICRRAASAMITAIADRMVGATPPDIPRMPPDGIQVIWPFLWDSAVARDPQNSLWTVGDTEVYWPGLDARPLKIINIKLRLQNVDDFLEDLAAAGANDNAVMRSMPAALSSRPIEPKWDWEGILIELIGVASQPDGLMSIPSFDPPKRGSQASLERWMKDAFAGNSSDGTHPSESEIRRRASAIMEVLQKGRSQG